MVRRIHSILLILALLVGGAGMNYMQAATYSGTCGANGNNVIWSLNTSTGVLTISGSGAMEDFVSSSGAPWYLDRMSITSVTIANGVTTIGNYAFYACVKLSSVAIPSSVTSIGNSGFSSCTKLTSVNIPNSVTNIGIYAFNHCSSLISVTIPNGVTSIGEFTFNGCSSLTSMTIPNSVASIGVSAFRDCSALTDVYSSWTGDAIPMVPSKIHNFEASQIRLHIPCGHADAYIAKEWNTKFTLSDVASGTCGDNVQWTFESCNGTLTISGTGGMYNWMSLADRPWHSLCTSIQRVVIEEGLTTTGLHAFYGASNLTSVSLPSTLQTLQFMTFFGCSKLTTLTIPSSVTYVGNRSLEGCSALTDVYMSETGDAIPTMPVGIHTYDASRITLHIPCGQAVNYIAKGWNTKFTIDGVVSGTCGDNVQWTFESCNGTLSIFGTGAMTDFESSADVPWYSYRSSIASVQIAEGVTSIGAYAFDFCTSLTSVSIPNSVTNIGRSAFYYCISLTSITIPNSVINISDFAFYHCSALSSVTIPNSVTSIGLMAFNTCTSLTSVIIPNSVTNLGKFTFMFCDLLTDIYVSWTSADAIPEWIRLTNNDPQSSVTLHVPCAAMSLYKAAEGWKDYTIEGEGGPYTITVESDDLSMGTVDAIKIDN